LNYDPLWKVLDRLILDLRVKGETIPKDVVDDLKSAKTLMDVYKSDVSYADTVSRIEHYLRSIESQILYLAETDFGIEYAEKCLEKINEARKKGNEPSRVPASKFISGVPRGAHWVRIKTTEVIEPDEIKDLAENLNLSYKLQEEGFILVHGDEGKVKTLLKEIAERMKKE
jgi:hypothetical protein